MTPELEALASTVEALTGPDREVDCLIWCTAKGITPEWQGNCLVAGHEGVIGYIDPGVRQRNFSTNRASQGPGSIPAYTASVDAALTLVPEGWDHLEVYQPDYQTLGWTVHIMPNANISRGSWSGFAQSYALALCAAALRSITPTQNHKGPHDE